MPLEAKRFRHLAVAIPVFAIPGIITACPRQETAVLRMHVPANVRAGQGIEEIDERGSVKPYDCHLD